jgi:hypothetical protein
MKNMIISCKAIKTALLLSLTFLFSAAADTNVHPLKILHISFHLGCIKDFEEVARELDLDLTSWYVLSSDLPREHFDGKTLGNAVYNITHERARMVWEKHKNFFNQFDVILTSDTAPLSRIFLQNGWQKPLIIWICNRFDYCDYATSEGKFPDREYYELFRAATHQPNVKIVGYTPYEHVYAKAKGIDTGSFTIKPLGSQEKGIRDKHETSIPATINKSETFFIYPRLTGDQLSYIKKKCSEIGLKTYSGRYNGPNDLEGFKGIIYYPYAWSNLAVFENMQRGIIHFIPSEKFILQMVHEGIPVRYVTLNQFELVEWYSKDYRPFFVYFDSWEDLKEKASKDYGSLSAAVKKCTQEQRKTMLDRWHMVFDECSQILTKNNLAYS